MDKREEAFISDAIKTLMDGYVLKHDDNSSDERVKHLRAYIAKLERLLDHKLVTITRDEIFGVTVEDANLSVRLYNILKIARINHISELQHWYFYEVKRLRMMGPAGLTELRIVMDKYNIKFKG